MEAEIADIIKYIKIILFVTNAVYAVILMVIVAKISILEDEIKSMQNR